MEILDHPEQILRWYLDAGVDEAVDEEPLDRYSGPVSQPPPEPVVKPVVEISSHRSGKPSRPSPTTSGADAAVKSAVQNARGAETLDELRDAVGRFDGCTLKKTAMNLVFGDGNPKAKVVLIGEAPGADEDRQGLPFVGASGRLLDKMLASIGLERSDVFVSNTVFWRPPGNRTPHAGEIAACLPFVERIIELIDPAVLITVGGPASHSLLAQQGSVSKLRGCWFSFETPRMSHPIAASVIYHPAYLLRSPAMKRQAWQDLLGIRRKLSELEMPQNAGSS